MVRSIHSFFPPSIFDAFETLCGLDESQFQALLLSVRGKAAFSVKSNRLEFLARELSVDPDDLGFMLQMLAALYSQVQRQEYSDDAIPEVAKEIVTDIWDGSEHEETKIDLLSGRLSHLLVYNECANEFVKIERLRSGFIKTVTQVDTFVDLRPDITENRDQVRQLVPVIQFRFITDATDPLAREFVFQLDPQSLNLMKKEITDVEDKLNALSNTPELSGLVWKEWVQNGD